MYLRSPNQPNMLVLLTYDFCTIEIHDNYIVVVMKEGITVKPEDNKVLEEIAKDYYEGRDFGYITYRKHSYAVDPRIYFKTSEIENLIGFAVVSTRKIAKHAAEVERIFLKKPYEYFDTIEEAVDWINALIIKKNFLN